MHIGPFLFGTFAVVFIFLLQFIYKSLSDLVGKGLSYGIIAEFIFYNLAWMLVLAVPMGVLVATLMAYGKLSGNNELTIIKSSGGSAFRAMMPAIIGGLLIFAALRYFNNEVLPETNHKAYVMQHDIKEFRPTALIEPGRFSKLEGYNILARSVSENGDTLIDVTIHHQDGATQNVINASRAEISYNHDMTRVLMTLRNGEAQRIGRSQQGEFRRFIFREYHVTINVSGHRKFEESDPTSMPRTDRTMNIEQMQEKVDTALAERERNRASLGKMASEAIGASDTGAIPMADATTRQEAARIAQNRFSTIRLELERLGMDMEIRLKDANSYLVEIHKKWSIPAACLIFVFVGAPLGIVVRRGNFGVSAVIALGFFVVFWACLVAGEKFADRGVFSPALAMWMADIIIGVLGIYLTILVSRETLTLSFDFSRLRNPLRRKKLDVKS